MTTVLSPIEFDHLVQVVHHKACGHRAECWCGWAGAWCDDYATADAAAHHHRETAAGPATGLDATLGGLLDLQDDLADTVLWLADNWSSDLPVPQAEPGGTCLDDGTVVPCLRLLVCAETTDELVEIADLLAAPVVLEAEPDAHGRRYQRATRTFGRVHMEAYAEVSPSASSVAELARRVSGPGEVGFVGQAGRRESGADGRRDAGGPGGLSPGG